MIARFPGECRRCGGLIRIGDDITCGEATGPFRPWWHVACPEDGPAFVARRIETRMLEQGVALGCWGIPAGAQATYSRREFFGLAEKAGVMNEKEAQILHGYWAEIWDRDLSD